MDVISIFGAISAIMFLGFIAEIIFKKLNIPDVILLIGTGIIIGSVLKVVSITTLGPGVDLFTTFALIFILFLRIPYLLRLGWNEYSKE